MATSSSTPPRRPLPQPVETTTKNTRRRFAPDPVETTARSNRTTAGKEQLAEAGSTSSKPRRFLPQPVETSVKTSKKAYAADDDAQHDFTGVTSNASRPLPQPIEPKPKPRKFSPQLIETVKRSRKTGDTCPAVLHSDKTEASPADFQPPRMLRPRPGLLPIPPSNSPVVSTDNIPKAPESRFTSSKLKEKATRQHSFRVPDLPSIQSVAEESEESNVSNCPSLSTTPSANSDEADLYKHASRVRESCDDRTSGYLLSLAAQAAEKQLREQAMAAYPNEHDYEPVDHFAFDQDSDESDGGEGEGRLSGDASKHLDGSDRGSKHRMGYADGWDMAEMRRHQEKLKKERTNRNVTKQSKLARQHSIKDAKKPKDALPVTDATGAPKNIIGGWQKGVGMAPMRNAASPPMAGENLKFPKCQSPRQTRLDVTQHHYRPNAAESATGEERTGLWTPNGGTSRKNSASGLWMGVCAASVQSALAPPKPAQTGLLTPAVERDDPFSSKRLPSNNQELPPSPPSSLENETLCLDRILSREETIEREFSDAFVTQIYNYLSLGYPSMARKYDTELAKITKISMTDLRRDDEHTNAKGYVGAPEGNGVDFQGVQEGQCARWLALRLYVREWARQQPEMVEGGTANQNEWGARARKGSWAI